MKILPKYILSGVDSWINLCHLKFTILPWRVVVRVVILRDTNRQINVGFCCFQHRFQLKSKVPETWPTFCIRMPSRQHHLISIIKKNTRSLWKCTILYKFKYGFFFKNLVVCKVLKFDVTEECIAYFGIFWFLKNNKWICSRLNSGKNWHYMSGEQFSGLSIRYPSLRRRNKSSFGIPGYGLPPNVTISHNTIPKDHLLGKRQKRKQLW